jgi:hypothetical protein
LSAERVGDGLAAKFQVHDTSSSSSSLGASTSPATTSGGPFGVESARMVLLDDKVGGGSESVVV